MSEFITPDYLATFEAGIAAEEWERRRDIASSLRRFSRTDPAGTWDVLSRYGPGAADPAREILADILGPLLWFNFDWLFPKVEALAASDPTFAHFLVRPIHWLGSYGPRARRPALDPLVHRLRASGLEVPPWRKPPSLAQIVRETDPVFFCDDLMQYVIDRRPRTPLEELAYHVLVLEAELPCGGFRQYFSNDSGDNAVGAEVALRAIGAEAHAAVVAAAHAVFAPHGPPSSTEKRRLAIEALGEAAYLHWLQLDRAYGALPPTVPELLRRYIKANRPVKPRRR